MTSIGVRQFTDLVEGKKYSVDSLDTYGISFHLSNVSIDYDKDLDEVNLRYEGNAITLKPDVIDSIIYYEGDQSFIMCFDLYTAGIEFRRIDDDN